MMFKHVLKKDAKEGGQRESARKEEQQRLLREFLARYERKRRAKTRGLIIWLGISALLTAAGWTAQFGLSEAVIIAALITWAVITPLCIAVLWKAGSIKALGETPRYGLALGALSIPAFWITGVPFTHALLLGAFIGAWSVGVHLFLPDPAEAEEQILRDKEKQL